MSKWRPKFAKQCYPVSFSYYIVSTTTGSAYISKTCIIKGRMCGRRWVCAARDENDEEAATNVISKIIDLSRDAITAVSCLRNVCFCFVFQSSTSDETV